MKFTVKIVKCVPPGWEKPCPRAPFHGLGTCFSCSRCKRGTIQVPATEFTRGLLKAPVFPSSPVADFPD